MPVGRRSRPEQQLTMSGCAPPFLRNSLTNKTKLKIKMTDTTSQASTESLPGFFDQQIHNILVMLLLQLSKGVV